MKKFLQKVRDFLFPKSPVVFRGSPRMTAVRVDEATRKLFANPPMSAIGNIPRGYEHIDD